MSVEEEKFFKNLEDEKMQRRAKYEEQKALKDRLKNAV